MRTDSQHSRSFVQFNDRQLKGPTHYISVLFNSFLMQSTAYRSPHYRFINPHFSGLQLTKRTSREHSSAKRRAGIIRSPGRKRNSVVIALVRQWHWKISCHSSSSLYTWIIVNFVSYVYMRAQYSRQISWYPQYDVLHVSDEISNHNIMRSWIIDNETNWFKDVISKLHNHKLNTGTFKMTKNIIQNIWLEC